MTRRAKVAKTVEEIAGCFPVMAELRPHLGEEEFIRRVNRQRTAGYELVFLEDEREVKAVAGFRIFESLAWGKYLNVDDLVTRGGDRSKGHGQILFDWLVAYARDAGCEELHLDSGVQRFGAHRFYLHKRMEIIAHHFSLKLGAVAGAHGPQGLCDR
jgi:GNAT superfamily N-acetyltransferase